MDMGETVGEYWDVLRRYLYVTVYFVPLAGRLHARVVGPMEVFEYLSPKGTSGWNVPVEESLMRSRLPTFCVMIRRSGLEWRACTCGQRI